jgi:trk system potassium uptake protein TrkA
MNVAILGLGRFGSELARELIRLGVSVMGADQDVEPVGRLVDDLSLAAEGNASDLEFLESLDLHTYDSVVVAFGSDVATSVLVTLTLKQRLKHRHVVAKASSTDHARALELAGADVVVNPEQEAAVRLAHTLGSVGLSDYMSLTGDMGIARMKAPIGAQGRPLEDFEPLGRFRVFLVARIRNEQVTTNPDLRDRVQSGDEWIVAGNDADLRRLRDA